MKLESWADPAGPCMLAWDLSFYLKGSGEPAKSLSSGGTWSACVLERSYVDSQAWDLGQRRHGRPKP